MARKKGKTSNVCCSFIFLLLGIILIISVMPVQAQEKPSVSLDAEALLISKYVWRGLEVNEDFVLQPSITTGYGQRQSDVVIRNLNVIVGKATETVSWDQVKETVTFNGKKIKVYLLAVIYTSG